MNQFRKWKTLVALFFGVFVYAFVAMVVSRELVIPRMMEQSTGGNIAGDSTYYHSLALKKTEQIGTKGITEFELRLAGQDPAGVASLLYLVWENPYSVVLLNAVLHGLSTVVMLLILLQYFPQRTSFIATLPLAISLYMIPWFSQINKDTFTLVGTLLFAFGLLKLLVAQEKQFSLTEGFPWWAMLICLGVAASFEVARRKSRGG